MIELKHPKGKYPIPKCVLVGYGREQIRQFICYSCGKEYFCNSDHICLDNFICEDCQGKETSVRVSSDIDQYIKIVNWRQAVSTFKRRTNFNFIKVAKRDNYTCQYCGYSPRLFVDFKPMHVDHIIPFSYGGNNSMRNLVMACSDCNLHLSNKIFKDFMDKKIYIVEWRKENRKPYTYSQWVVESHKIHNHGAITGL